MNDLVMIWNEVINMLELELNPIQLKTWIQPLIPLALDQDTLYLDSTSGFIHSMVDKKYKTDIESAISYICAHPITAVLVDPSMEEYEATLERFRNGVLPIGGDDTSNVEKSVPVSSPEEKRAVHPTQDEAVQKHWEEKKTLEAQRHSNGYATLNPKYTIDSFVRGASNDFAYATARAVIRKPGMVYNPLFIYGLSGLGKTHLMQAIAHEILKDPTKTVLYITSENFMNEMIAVIENGTNAEKENFRRKYRSIDCLLIDDIQFIAGKKATMEEVFHTFNDLKEAGKQIVLSADKPPKELKNLEDRLVTRFEGGMTVDIQQPDFETRVAILNHKMKGESLSLPQYIVEFIATHVTSNIRELEGALLRVLAYFRFKEGEDKRLSHDEALQTAREALKLEERADAELSMDEIMRRVADFYSLKASDFTSKSRQGNIVLPRQVAMYLCRELTNASLMNIGRAFDRDHTTVIHAVDKIRERMEKDETIKSDIEALTAQLTHV